MTASPPADDNSRRRILRTSLLITAGIIVLGATTAAAPGPEASRVDLMMYSYGSALVLLTAVTVVVKLFAYLIKAAFVLSVLLLLYLAGKFTVEIVLALIAGLS
jgi:hypothetical protein